MLYTKCEWDKTLHTEIQNFYRQYFYQVVSRENEWWPVTAKKKYHNGTFHANWYSTEAQCVTAFLTKPGGSHPTYWFHSFLGQI